MKFDWVSVENEKVTDEETEDDEMREEVCYHRISTRQDLTWRNMVQSTSSSLKKN